MAKNQKNKKNASLQYDLRRVSTRARYLILVFALTLLFLYPYPYYRAFAVGYFHQSESDYETAAEIDLVNGGQSLGQPSENFIIGTDGEGHAKVGFKVLGLFQIGIKVDGAYPNYPDTLFDVDCATTLINGVYYPADTCKSTTGKYLKDFEFQTGHTYALRVASNVNSKWVGSLTQFGGADLSDCYVDGSPVSCAPLKSIYLIIGKMEEGNTISIDFPENASSTPEFEVFLVSGNNIESAEDYRMLARVSFGTSSSSLNFCPGNFLSNENPELGPFESHIYNWFLEQPLITYYAQASLLYCPLTDPLECAFDPNLSCDNLGSYEIKATSTLISYFITGEEGIVGGGLPMPTSTASSSEWVMTCDPTDPLFTRSLCRLFQALFSPKQSDLNQFNDLRLVLQNKPPMGYFGAVKEIFSALNSTTTPAFVIMNVGPINNYIFTPIRTGLIIIFWLLFAFWIFHRFRNFEL